MNKTVRNVLIGVGIGLIIAPRPGRETVELLRTRLQRLGDSLLGKPYDTPASIKNEEPAETK